MQETSGISRATQAAPSPRPTQVRERPPDTSAPAASARDTSAPDAAAVATKSAAAKESTAAAPEGLSRAASVAAAAPSFGAGGSHARLSYDVEDADVYIEILNPRTGDVIRRLPPEDAVPLIRDIADAGPGAVIDGTV